MAVSSSKLCRSCLKSGDRERLLQQLPHLIPGLARRPRSLLSGYRSSPRSAVTALARPSLRINPALCQEMEWHSLGASPAELTLDFTLPTGQSFRWRRTGDAEFTGVVDSRVVKVQQLSDDIQYQVLARGSNADVSQDAAVLKDYFNLQASLSSLCQEWSNRDERFRKIHTYFPGARVLRQDPVECLFEFICSSNNHISRIHGMVERLCRDYGAPLLHRSSQQTASLADADQASTDASVQGEALQSVPDLAFYAFPTLEQLSAASESALRAEGFGYRAKFITGSVQALLAKPGGGRQWLYSLRDVPYQEAAEALCELPGIGPKVAACICLFALDKQQAIPVDTHVWQLAVRYYTPHLKGKTMNKKIMVAVEKAFIDRFGPWAGWAHNTLFISELASQRERLPEHLQPAGKVKTTKGQNAAALKAAEAAAAQEQAALEQRGLSSAADSDALPTLARKRRKTAKARQAEADQQEGLGIARRDASTDASESALSTQAGDSVPQDEQLGLQAKQSLTSSSSVAAAALAAVDQAVENAAVLPVQRSKKKKGKGMN